MNSIPINKKDRENLSFFQDLYNVKIPDIGNITIKDRKKISSNIKKYNFTLFELNDCTNSNLLKFANNLGLEKIIQNPYSDKNGVSNITAIKDKRQGEYIPYTNKKLNWHTDGYYNSEKEEVRAFILYCKNPAIHGGENYFLDHRILYKALMKESKNFIGYLTQKDVFKIPSNKNLEINRNFSSFVFNVDKANNLTMRYTMREKNIEWKSSEQLPKIKKFIDNFLDLNNPLIFKIKLKKNQGIIANNVLHARSSYEDLENNKRFLLRLRFGDELK